MIDFYLNAKDPWLITEKSFNSKQLAKFESIFAQGNGKLGIRAALEEAYTKETRNTFMAGTFNKAFENEVTELPNLMDTSRFDVFIDGQPFSLLEGEILSYERTLNLKNGELTRKIQWTSPEGNVFNMTFQRIVSMEDLHLFASKVTITLLRGTASNIEIVTGIDGKVTNSGSQHLMEARKRLFDHKILQYIAKTNQSNVTIVVNTTLKAFKDSRDITKLRKFAFDRREAMFKVPASLSEGETLYIEKTNTYHSSRDKDDAMLSVDELSKKTKNYALNLCNIPYTTHKENTACAWSKIWENESIHISSKDSFDQLAVRFAQYHLHIMTPKHDNRMNIGAKGLTGEGYKGHTFWDSDIFILPYWTYNDPKTARRLLEYRYLSLAGARAKAKENGFEGAMYPWESAWLKDGEVTPTSGGTNILTGEPEKIITGHKEIHRYRQR